MFADIEGYLVQWVPTEVAKPLVGSFSLLSFLFFPLFVTISATLPQLGCGRSLIDRALLGDGENSLVHGWLRERLTGG